MKQLKMKKQILSEIAHRLIMQWPEDGMAISIEELRDASTPLDDALDRSRMDGDLNLLAFHTVDLLRKGIIEAIWLLDRLPLASAKDIRQKAGSARQQKIDRLNTKIANRL